MSVGKSKGILKTLHSASQRNQQHALFVHNSDIVSREQQESRFGLSIFILAYLFPCK